MVNGTILTIRDDGSRREDSLFRISLKAVIYNDKGELLVVKEHGLNWGLPGGGMDFGETFETALARELREEVGYEGRFTFDVVDTADPMYLPKIDAWQVYVVCRVIPEHFNFSIGVDTVAIKFIDPSELAQYDDSQARYATHYHVRLQERLARP